MTYVTCSWGHDVAAEEIEELRKIYEGEIPNRDAHIALMVAIKKCAHFGMVMPNWVAEGYINAFKLVEDYEADSWDDVFGPLWPKGAHLDRWRRDQEAQLTVFLRCSALIREGRAIDEALFEQVGRESGIGAKTKVGKLYYRSKKAEARREARRKKWVDALRKLPRK